MKQRCLIYNLSYIYLYTITILPNIKYDIDIGYLTGSKAQNKWMSMVSNITLSLIVIDGKTSNSKRDRRHTQEY